MSSYLRKALVLIFAVLFVVAPVFEEMAQAHNRHSGNLRRLAANFRGFEGIASELQTIAPPSGTPTPGSGGAVIYQKTLYIPRDINVLFATVTAGANSHDGARLMMTCLIDGVPCNPGQIASGAPAGWVVLQRYADYNRFFTGFFTGDGGGAAGDLHNNSINYTWCTKLSKSWKWKPRTITIKLASFNLHGTILPFVTLEGVHFFIDGARLRGPNACTVDTTPRP